MSDSSSEEDEYDTERLLDEPGLREPLDSRTRRGRFVRMPFVKNGSMWFVWDPCGIVCAVMTYLLIVYGEFVMLTVLAPPFPDLWTALNVVVFTSFGLLAVVAHVKSMVTDPVSEEGRESVVCE